ncbi:MAG: hypothetical protein ABI045_04015 [Flavobacteriales bacterium]
MKKIAIQEVKDSFHHAAVAKHFGASEYTLFKCITFKALTEAVAQA